MHRSEARHTDSLPYSQSSLTSMQASDPARTALLLKNVSRESQFQQPNRTLISSFNSRHSTLGSSRMPSPPSRIAPSLSSLLCTVSVMEQESISWLLAIFDTLPRALGSLSRCSVILCHAPTALMVVTAISKGSSSTPRRQSSEAPNSYLSTCTIHRKLTSDSSPT